MLSREEKERLYQRKMTTLQKRWGNPIDSNWTFVKGWSDQELDESIADTVGQLRFEKFWSVFTWSIGILVAIGLGALAKATDFHLDDWSPVVIIAVVWYVGYAIERKLNTILKILDEVKKSQ